ncbi:SDA1-domain-containing protein [Scenedesmus sp. NREL 46B-D3]|nr:SDA1-domain-containing protein [Scenedesmus sp. NREL 46B-D3]
MLQYRHYQACLQLFQLKPSQDSKEFADCITFIAQVSKCYPTSSAGFAPALMQLLEEQQARLDAALRRAMVQALILLRNRNQLDPVLLLPLLFKLFRVNDKQLRELLFRHIIADLKASNQKGRNERLNKSVQSFLYSVIADDNELAAKKSLAVLSELWRRHIWRDGRTVNCIGCGGVVRQEGTAWMGDAFIVPVTLLQVAGELWAAWGLTARRASAVFHKSPAVMAAALKFFLGQDAAAGDDDESDEEGGDGEQGKTVVAAPTKEEVYKATHKGTKSSKKKKQAKLKRVMSTLKKHARKEAALGSEGFAALHLLHDPQGFAERLFGRLQGSRERWETRLDMMTVTSRVIGVHKLLVLNFYPFLQKYIAPHQRDVTAVLASLAQAVHELVPPESLAPVLRQLVDQFVHDRARPEVMTVGLKAVRELSLRCPLVMTEELLQDLSEYKRFRDKEVATAARGLIGAFRELNPALLNKRDRGRAADLAAAPASYGASAAAERLEGAELLEADLARGGLGSDEDSDDYGLHFDGSSSSEEAGSEEAGSEGEGEGGSDDEGGDSEDAEQDSRQHAQGSDDEDAAKQQQQQQQQLTGSAKKQQQQQQQGSLASLKKQLAAAKAAKEQQQQDDGGGGDAEAAAALAAGVPIEMTRILTEDDFKRIRELKRRALIKSALSRHGLAGASEAKKRRAIAAAETEADEALALASKKAKLSDAQVAPDDLTGRHKKRKSKEERLASVMAGREGREAFGSRTGIKKKKRGGLSEREKQRSKSMPIAARIQQLRNRSVKARNKSNPRHFKGHVRK